MRSRKAAATLAAALLVSTAAAARARVGAGEPRREQPRREQPATVRLSHAAMKRRAVVCAVPRYPGGGHPRHLRVRSTVEVEVLLDERGRVLSARVVKGHPLLHAPAAQAARRWRFRPLKVAGRPARASGVLRVFFSPEAAEMERQCDGLRRDP